jgi:hypothetical protein
VVAHPESAARCARRPEQGRSGRWDQDSRSANPAIVAGCIDTALGLLDDWLTNSDPRAPKRLGQCVHLPAGHWLGERAATDILVLAANDAPSAHSTH